MSGAALSAAAAQRKDNILPVIKKMQAAGVATLMGIAGALNARGFKTLHGGEWSAKQVSPAHARRLIGLHGLLIAS